jgi:hypothetical protein
MTNLRYGIAGAVLTAAVLGGFVAAIPSMAEAMGTRSAQHPTAAGASAAPKPEASAAPKPEAAAAPKPDAAAAPKPAGARAEPAGRKPKAMAVPKPRWRNSKQFQEVKSGRITENGLVALWVRPARKEILGESFRTVPVPGPYTEVLLTEHARILLLDGESGSPDTFAQDLAHRKANRPGHVSPDQRQEGFTLTYDANGRVSQVDWLYVL